MATSDSPQTGIYHEVRAGSRDSTMHVDTSSVINLDGSLNAASGKVTLPGVLGQGWLDLNPHLFGARNSASAEKVASGSSAPTAFWGGLLMPDGAPSLDMLSTANPIYRLQWASANVASIVLPPIAMPSDLSTAGGLNLQLYGETVGTASAADAIQAIQIVARTNPRSSATAADIGSTHPNFTSTPSWQGIAISSANLTTDNLSVQLIPQAHAARAINVYGMRGYYTRKTS